MTGFGPSQIKEFLPHRPPTLLIDQVLDLKPGEWLTAVKTITVEATWYEGVVGPDHSYPGSLLFESFGQAAALLLIEAWHPGSGMAGDVPILGGLTGVHFDMTVEPGDTVQHHVHIDRIVNDNAIVHGHSTVGEQTVMRVERVILALRPRQQVR